MISLLIAATLAGTYVAVERGTRAELEQRLDEELELQIGEFESFGPVREARDPAQLERASERFLDSQRYHPSSTIFLIDVEGGGTVTNQPEIVEGELEDEGGSEDEDDEGEEEEEERSLVGAPPGWSKVELEETGELRVLRRQLSDDGMPPATFQVAEPLAGIEEAESGLSQTLALVAAIALGVSIAGAIAIAASVARPLRRMSRIASEVQEGNLDLRIGGVATGDEITALAESFDRMLDRLEAAFARQRDFVSDASHELRTPLTVLRGQVEALRRAGDPAERERIVALLEPEIVRMERLVDDLLVLARAEAGTLVEPAAIDLTDFFEDLRRDMPLFGDRDYRVPAPAPGSLEADPDRLLQAIRNLVRNAVEHTEPGDRVTVTATPRDGVLEIAVTDTGSGIPPDQLDRIFDRFHRTDGARSRTDGGAGLGLAIARAIAEAHGGRIRVSSEPGAGATFVLELPGLHSDLGST